MTGSATSTTIGCVKGGSRGLRSVGDGEGACDVGVGHHLSDAGDARGNEQQRGGEDQRPSRNLHGRQCTTTVAH